MMKCLKLIQKYTVSCLWLTDDYHLDILNCATILHKNVGDITVSMFNSVFLEVSSFRFRHIYFF